MMGVLIGWMCFNDPLTLKKAAGVLIGIMGITLLTSTGPVTLSMSVVMGALACLVATSCYGAAGFLAKRWVADKGGAGRETRSFWQSDWRDAVSRAVLWNLNRDKPTDDLG